MSKSKASILALAIALSACGQSVRYDLDQPIQVVVDPDMPRAGAFLVDVVQAIGALGGDAVGTPAAQTVRVVYTPDDTECSKGKDHAYVVQYGPDPDTIHVCRDLPTQDEAGIKDLVYHELGHVLGAQHLVCGQHGVMTPFTWCYHPPNVADGFDLYTDTDLSEICRLTVGGACSRG